MRATTFPCGKTYPFRLRLFAIHDCGRCMLIGQVYPCADCSSLHSTLRDYFQDAGKDMLLEKQLELAEARGN